MKSVTMLAEVDGEKCINLDRYKTRLLALARNARFSNTSAAVVNLPCGKNQETCYACIPKTIQQFCEREKNIVKRIIYMQLKDLLVSNYVPIYHNIVTNNSRETRKVWSDSTYPKQRKQQACHHDVLLWLACSSNLRTLPIPAPVLLPITVFSVMLKPTNESRAILI